MWSVSATMGGAAPITGHFGSLGAKPLGFTTTTSNTFNYASVPLRPSSSKSFLFLSSSSSSSLKTALAAVDSEQLNPDKQEATKYYFLVANAKFMLNEEEHFKELLFERLRNFGERKKEQDFWLVIEPKFLDKFPNVTQRLRRPAVALVSTNGPWITFMKLRLDRVLSNSYEAANLDEALASNPVTLDFEKQEKWSAPYPKYEFGWWEPFLPKGLKEAKV